jgi:hypothetical protein
MIWREPHATILSQAFEKLLGRTEQGSIAFVRCLASHVVEALASDERFAPADWQVCRVADRSEPHARTITADQAVELREAKGKPLLLLVDTTRAGAGMDGIYSAAREIEEANLFKEAMSRAGREVTQRISSEARKLAEQAIKKARWHGQRFSIPPWTEFDFLVRVAAEERPPGELLYLIGLWPIAAEASITVTDLLDISRLFVDRLLGTAVAGLPPSQRIAALRLQHTTADQQTDLERFLRQAAAEPRQTALERLAERKDLWVGPLQVESSADRIQSITLVPWQTRNAKIAKWSGLIEDAQSDEPRVPVLVLDPDADNTGNYSKLEVRWKARPENLEKGAVEYRVAVMTDLDEELTSREVSHSGKKEEKCRFSNDDFSMLSDDALISAKVVVSVLGSDVVEPQETEEFQIRFGSPGAVVSGGVGKKCRTFSEAVIELGDREGVTTVASSTERLPVDSKGYLLLRTPQRDKSYRAYCPPLVREVEQQWGEQAGAIGRWRVRVRASGARAHAAEFVPFDPPIEHATLALWARTCTASRRLAERFAQRSGCGQVYDQAAKTFDNVVKEYVLAWAALLDGAEPALALASTVEVQSLSGRTIGLIVLPSHPLRVAWHVAYDNLVLHAAYEQGLPPKKIREEFSILDGAIFPALLPGLQRGTTFVFADTLGFHSVGMVADNDKEPKASIALLARALGETESVDTVPTVGRQSAQILGQEILKYLECHDGTRFLQIHALRAGDGLTVARSLGHVQKSYQPDEASETEDIQKQEAPAFVLELYPSEEQRVIAGRFIAETREKRRSGAGVLAEEDRWMLESLNLPGGTNLPRLRWARKEKGPQSAAHLAVAFDTFESHVAPDPSGEASRKKKPLYAYGLLSFFDREYESIPAPVWRTRILEPTDGEKHPADRSHTDRLCRMQQTVERCVARHLGVEQAGLVLETEISAEKADSLRHLHRLCDWVITLDRNAGIEYFDSPRDNREIYDAYVIDCVPEREDLGCLQLITSTSNLDEVRRLLDAALDQMGLSHSRRNAEFLMGHLKALSGRLAIRLTGQKAPTSELIALALCHAHARRARENNECWPSLRSGYLIPVDDVQDLMPPVHDLGSDANGSGADRAVRPDLIHISAAARSGLLFRFIEVKYRRHLRDARSPEVLKTIQEQVESLRRRWNDWYSSEDVPPPFRSLRRAKLARVLRFYADKARRHADDERNEGLSLEAYQSLVSEIDRMIEKGTEYSFADEDTAGRGWVFCPEYAGVEPLMVSPPEWDTRIFLFGPEHLPDSPSRLPDVEGGMPNGPNEQTSRLVPQNAPAAGTPSEPKSDIGDAFAASTHAAESVVPERGPEVCLGTDQLTGQDVWWPLTIKGNPHLLLAGLPGMGKTTCLLNLCTQMVGVGIRPIVFSYHEDIDHRLLDLMSEVRFVDFHGLGFNPLEVIDRQSRLGYLDVAGTLRDIFTAIFPELGDIQGESIRNAIKQSFIETGWDAEGRDLQEIEEPPFERFVEILKSYPKPDRGLRTLLARLEELADYGFFALAESHDSLWESERPIVIRIHKTQNDVLQKAFAALVFYKLYKDMFRRGTQVRITHAVIFDEAHRAARLTLIPTMAKECRKYGISLVLASQEARDFNVSIFSAIANYLMLRVTEADAKALVRNVASSDQERTLIDKLKQMERFKALYFSEQRKKPCQVILRS